MYLFLVIKKPTTQYFFESVGEVSGERLNQSLLIVHPHLKRKKFADVQNSLRFLCVIKKSFTI